MGLGDRLGPVAGAQLADSRLFRFSTVLMAMPSALVVCFTDLPRSMDSVTRLAELRKRRNSAYTASSVTNLPMVPRPART